jgi:protein TonB
MPLLRLSGGAVMATTVGSLEPLRKRGFALAAIAGGHVLLVYFLMNGLAQQVLSIVSTPPIVADFLPDEHRERPLPPPLPTPDLATHRLTVAEPPWKPPVIKDPPETIETPPGTGTVIDDPGDETLIAPPPLVLIGKNELPNTEDYYPARARRDGQEGVSEVRVCVDERGRLQGDPTIQRSSGSALLDGGAVAVTRAGHYARATRGGVAVPACYGFRIAFRMK